MESAQEILKISRCFVLWEPWNWGYSKKSDCIWFSQAMTPHTYIFLIQGSRVSVEMGTYIHTFCVSMVKFGMVTSMYGALMLLNFCGDWRRGLGASTKLFGGSNWRKLLGSKVLGICLKLSLAKKIYPQTTPASKNFKKMTKYSFFCKFFTRYD